MKAGTPPQIPMRRHDIPSCYVPFRSRTPMNLRQIEVFKAVMSTGSITNAARLLHVSQPGISRLVKHLELQLGVALFERRGGRVVATPEAHLLHAEVEKVYHGVRHVRDVAAQLRFGTHATLKVLSSANTGLELVPRAIAGLLQRFPHVQIAFETLPTREIVKLLVAEEADLAISSAPLDHPVLDVREFGRWSMLCALPPRHPLAARAGLDMQAVWNERLILYSAEAPQSQAIEEWAARAGAAPRRGVEVRSGYAACSMVAQGIGIAFVDDLTARAFRPGALQLRAVARAPQYPLLSVSNVNKPLSAIGNAFLQLARTELKLLQKESIAV